MLDLGMFNLIFTFLSLLLVGSIRTVQSHGQGFVIEKTDGMLVHI